MQTIDVSISNSATNNTPIPRPGFQLCPGCGMERCIYAGETEGSLCYGCERERKMENLVKQRIEASKKRTREVFPSNEIAHLWAHQAIPKGRTPSNMSFDGPDFYSYGTVIASITTNPKGKRAYLLSDRTYSNSTSSHQSDVRQAIPHGATVFTVPGIQRGGYGFSDSGRILQAWTDEVNETLEESYSSREPKKSRLIISASKTVAKMREFVKFMGIKGVKYPKIPATKAQLADMQKLVEEFSVKARAAADKASATRRANESAEREARRIAYAQQEEERKKNAVGSMEAWKQGENISTYSFGRYFPTLLRVKDGNVETSMGASFPVDHARRGLVLVKATMQRGEEWRSNGHTCRLGHYGIDRITADGTVYAGCHVVPYASIEAIEGQLTDTAPGTEGAVSESEE